jgi:hypothetical protein
VTVRSLHWAASLLIVLALACLMLGWMQWASECKGKPETWDADCPLVKFLYDWQQLLAGLVAIGAAIIGWSAINRQIRQSDEQEQERYRRRLAASRAVLPLALSGVSTYCVEALMPLFVQSSDERVLEPEKGWRPPDIPSSAIGDLRSMVEASTASVAVANATLLARLQTQASRLRSLGQDWGRPEAIVTRSGIEQFIVDTIEIQARANELFVYGRGQQDDVGGQDDPTLKQMTSAAFSLNIYPGLHPRIDERIDRLYGNRPTENGVAF